MRLTEVFPHPHGPQLHITVVGLLLAAVVLAGVIGVLWWMLHPGKLGSGGAFPEDDGELADLLLVPVTPGSPPELLHLAAMLAREMMAGVVLLHVVEVPFTLPLDVQDAQAAQTGREFMRDFRRTVEARGASVELKVARARRAGKTIIDWARTVRPKAIVLGARPHAGGLGATTAYVLENAGPFRVVVVKP